MASEPRRVHRDSLNFAVPKPKVTVYTDENALKDNPFDRQQSRVKPVLSWKTPEALRKSSRVPLADIGGKSSDSEEDDYYIEPSQRKLKLYEEMFRPVLRPELRQRQRHNAEPDSRPRRSATPS